jgi:hypothetical protein
VTDWNGQGDPHPGRSPGSSAGPDSGRFSSETAIGSSRRRGVVDLNIGGLR